MWKLITLPHFHADILLWIDQLIFWRSTVWSTLTSLPTHLPMRLLPGSREFLRSRRLDIVVPSIQRSLVALSLASTTLLDLSRPSNLQVKSTLLLSSFTLRSARSSSLRRLLRLLPELSSRDHLLSLPLRRSSELEPFTKVSSSNMTRREIWVSSGFHAKPELTSELSVCTLDTF